MAKKNFKGIERIFSSTSDKVEFEVVTKPAEEEAASEAPPSGGELPGTAKNKKPENEENDFVNYNVKYPRTLQRRIKRYCIERKGIDMRDIFIQGAIMYMDKNP